MKERVMKMWTRALRSGKYKQGRGALCSINNKNQKSFCCLGVLCDLYNKEQKKNKKATVPTRKVELLSPSDLNPTGKKDTKYLVSYDGNDGVLPPVVIEWAGFSEDNAEGQFSGFDMPQLITLNDGSTVEGERARTFKYIADVIEENHMYL